MNYLVIFIIFNLVNSILLMYSVLEGNIVGVISSIYLKLGIYGFNSWILTLCNSLNIESVYLISIILKVLYIMLIWKYNLVCNSIILLLIGIILLVFQTHLCYNIKELIMVSSIVQYVLFILGSNLLYSYVYILLYILSNIMFISVFISYNTSLLVLNVLNLLGIPRLLGFFLKYNYYSVLLGLILSILCIVVLLVYVVNSYMYISLLYGILLSHLYLLYYLGYGYMIYVLICMS